MQLLAACQQRHGDIHKRMTYYHAVIWSLAVVIALTMAILDQFEDPPVSIDEKVWW